MKKLKNFKGFTLVELLLSIAILSIVMLVIIAILRSASINYTKGNFDVSAQSEAQILLSQMEEILIDANKPVKTNFQTDYEEYIIDENLASEKHIKWDFNTYELWYKDKDNTTYSLMAERVVDFVISGIDNTSKDNACVVSVDIYYVDRDGNMSRDYRSSQKVYFRNNVEDKSNYTLSFDSDDDDEDDPDPSNGRIVDRYEVVNLKNEFGIVKVTSISDAYAVLKSTNYNASTDSLSKAEYASTGSDFYIISCAAGTNDNLISSFSGTVVGQDAAGNSISVNLQTPAWKVEAGANVLELPRKSFNSPETYYMYIPMEGFDIYDYNKYWRASNPTVYPAVEGSIDILKNGSSTGANSGSNLKEIKNGDSASGWFQANAGILNQNTQVGKFALVADPYDNDNIVLGMYDNAGYIENPNIINGDKCEAKIKVVFPSASVPENQRTFNNNFRLKTMGSSLSDL